MQTRTFRWVPIAGVFAAASLLALSGCGGHSATGRTFSDPPSTGSQPAGRPPAIMTGTPTTGTPTTAPGSDAAQITTTGTSTVRGAPDTMTMSIRLSTTDAHAAAALARNSAITLAVQRALEGDGVAVKDMQTTDLSLQDTYPPSPAAFEADDEVTATLHDLARAGSVIDHAVATAGDAGRLDGVTFSLSDTSPLMAAARQQAVAAARADATQLANAAGAHLGGLRVLTDETYQNSPQPYSAVPEASSAPTTAPVPVQPGTQQLSVVVTATWSLTS